MTTVSISPVDTLLKKEPEVSRLFRFLGALRGLSALSLLTTQHLKQVEILGGVGTEGSIIALTADMRLNPKIIGLVLGVLLVSMSVLSIPLYWYSRAAMDEALGDQLKRLSQLVSQNLNQDLLSTLTRAPELSGIKQAVGEDLQRFDTPGVEGMTIYTIEGRVLAESRMNRMDETPLKEALPQLLTLQTDMQPVVSEIFQLSNGKPVKAVAQPLLDVQGNQVVLVIWVGAGYVQFVEQMTGSLFWIMLAAAGIAVILTVIFTRSLIRPVRQLSEYAGAIQKNINSEPVKLGRSDEFGDLNQALNDMHAEIKEQEEAARQLLAGIAHEIKNPLGGMEIYAGLLKDEVKDMSDTDRAQEAQAYLERVTRELHHLKQIVQEYLDYARPLKNVIETLDVGDVFQDVQPILRPQLEREGQSISLSGTALVSADRSKLNRVFINLIQNGLQAGGKGTQVEVLVHDSPEQVYIDFKDTGPGITKEDRERVFEPYFSTQDRGYGLGLAIVRSIVAELGGTIIVQSSSQEGTVMRVELPVSGA